MKVYCPVCHKRYGQAKLKQNEKVGIKCECGTWFEVEKLRITYVPIDEVNEIHLSYDTLGKEVEARIDLDILKQRLTSDECKLLDLMAEGYEFGEIAGLLKVDKSTITRWFQNIQKKANE